MSYNSDIKLLQNVLTCSAYVGHSGHNPIQMNPNAGAICQRLKAREFATQKEGFGNIILGESSYFNFQVNQAGYRVLAAGMQLAREMERTYFMEKIDCQLETGTQGILNALSGLEIVRIPKKDNTRADLLVRLFSSKNTRISRTVIGKGLDALNAQTKEIVVMEDVHEWMRPIICYLIWKLNKRVHLLEVLEGVEIPRTRNISNLRCYFS